MNKIKFSHKYNKLINVYSEFLLNRAEAQLLEVIQIDYKDLSKAIIDYDTTFIHRSKINRMATTRQYQLSQGKLILLIFDSLKTGLFTTIRPFNQDKLNYYKSKLGQSFILEVTEG